MSFLISSLSTADSQKAVDKKEEAEGCTFRPERCRDMHGFLWYIELYPPFAQLFWLFVRQLGDCNKAILAILFGPITQHTVSRNDGDESDNRDDNFSLSLLFGSTTN